MPLIYHAIVFILFGFVNGQLSSNWKEEILQLHNEYRQQIRSCSATGQPPAKSMALLRWNENLAMKAQRLADQCRVGHDSAEERQTDPWQWVGQNWAGVQDVKTSVPSLKAVKMWFEEYVNYDFGSGQCRSGMCGHYTQLIWAKTTDVGCGVRDCGSGATFPYGLSIVCNYGPG
ncbi:unnamed protein product [Echinostoma caproni]|uniref:SCP domain-containing protein n=1 Tax=Echinostoma caproni TaxID=27848 RepID=A0A183AIH1_9TREM|nr:unnamed protein product [Echinostoma caproni]